MEDMKSRIKNCCLEKEPPFCVSSCPFHLDVREFISRVQRGGFNLAYRLYANAVGFPFIVSALCDEPCKERCPRKKIDDPIELRLLEKSCVDYSSNTKPNNYNMPDKGKKIAVIGAGICGLACTLRLANKKYSVTVFEKGERIGGHLWDILDPEIFMDDINRQFMYENYDLRLNTEITDIDRIAEEYDAVFVATGQNGADYGLVGPCGGVKGVVASSMEGVFIGGSVIGAGTIDAIAQGLKASMLLESYMKTGNMKAGEENPPTEIKLAQDTVTMEKRVFPSCCGNYTKEEAVSESKRCIRCRCDACMRSCEMMQYFQKFPKQIEEEVHITIHPGTLDGNGTVATRLISTCNQCGLCSSACPEDIDVGLFMRHSHNAMRDKGAMPWAFHEFWLRDMEFANSERTSLIYRPDKYSTARYMFFPGCQLGASNPDYVTRPYDFLREKMPDTALALMCCGAPAIWAGEHEAHREICARTVEIWKDMGEPVAVFACSTCREMFAEYLPRIKGISLYELLAELGIEVPVSASGKAVSVFDPCSSRKFPGSQKIVRDFVSKAGHEIIPLQFEGGMAKCCSWGGQISIANPTYTKWLVDKRVDENDLPYIAYCSNCRDIFAEAGKSAVHVLDILFSLGGWERKAPTFSERRRGREYLKQVLAGKLLPEKDRGEVKMQKITMTPEIAEKLHKDKILEDDVLEVIEFCESRGRKLLDPKTGHYLGYTEIGHMTCWVEYESSEDGYRLHNAYSHRMKIELEEVWHGRKQNADM